MVILIQGAFFSIVLVNICDISQVGWDHGVKEQGTEADANQDYKQAERKLNHLSGRVFWGQLEGHLATFAPKIFDSALALRASLILQYGCYKLQE